MRLQRRRIRGRREEAQVDSEEEFDEAVDERRAYMDLAARWDHGAAEAVLDELGEFRMREAEAQAQEAEFEPPEADVMRDPVPVPEVEVEVPGGPGGIYLMSCLIPMYLL